MEGENGRRKGEISFGTKCVCNRKESLTDLSFSVNRGKLKERIMNVVVIMSGKKDCVLEDQRVFPSDL